MIDFHFANPDYLYALPALAALFFLVRWLDKNVENRLARFLHEVNLRALLRDKGTISRKGRAAAYWLSLMLITLALARPQANPTVEETQSSGLDIYVLLDVSRSMDTEDVAPSRLKKAKRTIQHLASRLAGDRIGIIAFANSAVLVSPLTNDYSIIDSYLKNIDTSIVPSQGTNFGNALETAKEAMERGAKNTGPSAKHTNIFLMLSDGEDHADTDLGVVDEIRKAGGLVFTIAFGTDKGAPIPMRDDHGELRGYKKDSAGNVVVTKVETKTLEEIAQRGGGQFYHSTLDEGEVDDILNRVNDAQRGSFTTIKTTVWEEFFWAFLAPGVFFLLVAFVPLGTLLPSRLRRPAWLSRARAATKVSALLAATLIAPGKAEAGPISFFWDQNRKASEQSASLAKEKKFSEAVDALKGLQAENPDSPELNYDIGTYLLSDKKGEQGREQLSHLRNDDGDLRDLAEFNIAGSLAQEGKKEEARAAYAELLSHLARKPKLSDAESQLLGITKRNVARLADPNQPPPQDQKQNQQNQQDQKDQQKQGGGGGGDDKKDSKDQNKDGKGDDKNDKDKGKNDQDKNKGDQDKKDQDKGQGDKDKDQQSGQNKGNDQQNPGQDQLPPRRGGQPFKERDDMGETEAKRILGALKDRESDLQKKLLKNQVKGGRVNVDDAGKDW